MFNRLRELSTSGGGTGANTAPPNASLTFDNGDAVVHFENQLQAPPGAPIITQPQEDDGLAAPPVAFLGAGGVQPPGAPPPPLPPAGDPEPYSGMDSALKGLGHMLYSEDTINAKLAVQSGTNPGDPASWAAFWEFVTNGQQFRVYLAMLGGQPYVTMIQTPGVYFSIALATSQYQGKVLAFIGDRRATKEPTLVCLPTTKMWEWHTGHANCSFDKLKEFYSEEANKGKLWMPGAGEGIAKEVKVPNLLAIPNALMNLLRPQGTVITPYAVLETVNNFIESDGHPGGPQWDCVCKWCLVASQTGTNEKSKVFMDTSPITINDEEFDCWVGNRLDVSLGPRPTTVATLGTPGAPVTQQGMDYLALAKMLATTICANMMNFSNAIAPQILAAMATGSDTPLATGKGFDQDQIAKLKDVCGVHNAQHIPAIWSVIQATKGKSIDSYRAHLSKSIKSWCRAHHINRDKPLFLEATFFKDLVALRFNPGGPVVQFHSVARGMSMLACRSLTVAEAEQSHKYKEAAASTKHTRSLDKLLKWNRGRTVWPAASYMELKLKIGTYCGLLWLLFGDHCNYYCKLIKIYRILDREECFTIRTAYTKEVCTRITWAIIDDGRLFFGCNPVASDFASGTNFQFSTSHLESIMDSVQNAIPIQRAMFPREWIMPQVASRTPRGGMPQGKPPTQWTPPAVAPGATTSTKPLQQREDIRHPKIRLLMDPYLKRYNNFVCLFDILTACGKRMTDLPTLTNYCHPTGQSFLCWNSVLGRCFRGLRCKYSKGYVKKGGITNESAKAILDCISKGVLHYINLLKGESPTNKRRRGGGGATSNP
jgi:hypothetical protein